MGLFGFQIRPVSGPEIVDFWGLNGPEPAQNPLEVVVAKCPTTLSGAGPVDLECRHIMTGRT